MLMRLAVGFSFWLDCDLVNEVEPNSDTSAAARMKKDLMELIYDNPTKTLVDFLMAPHLDSASVLQQLLQFMSAGLAIFQRLLHSLQRLLNHVADCRRNFIGQQVCDPNHSTLVLSHRKSL